MLAHFKHYLLAYLLKSRYTSTRGVREKINFGFAKSAINMSCPYMRK